MSRARLGQRCPAQPTLMISPCRPCGRKCAHLLSTMPYNRAADGSGQSKRLGFLAEGDRSEERKEKRRAKAEIPPTHSLSQNCLSQICCLSLYLSLSLLPLSLCLSHCLLQVNFNWATSCVVHPPGSAPTGQDSGAGPGRCPSPHTWRGAAVETRKHAKNRMMLRGCRS